MKLYTKTGDEGKTGIIGGRVDKDDLRVEAYGTVDELNCFIGQAVSFCSETQVELRNRLQQIQHDLFDLGVDLASKTSNEHKITSAKVEELESWIDHYSEETPAITYFILPGGTQLASTLHVCRAVCRRAERAIVSLGKRVDVHTDAKKYINRLSDLLFAASRIVNHQEDVLDIRYESR